ncbi:MAG TPA: Uma2 family endonuclease [Solirubrobacteraceae bacterium]|jgi:Uma2 family endonuclease|nr:Uma2 family endonuclease [Solirubrobacteraceae bacterium]
MATATSDLPLYRLDVDTCHRLADAGALDGMDVELLDGLLIDKDSAREDPIHRIDVDTYNRMVLTGALDGLHIELLDGLLVEMSPISPAHTVVVTRLMRHFAAAPQWWTQVQSPVEIRPRSEPEPDLLVAASEPPPGQHLRGALLAIEVAVSSHRADRGRKATLFSEADISTYWLVDLPGRAIEVRTRPGRHGYEQYEVYHEGSVVPSPLDGVADLDIAALLADV